MSWVGVAVAGATIVGSVVSSNAAGNAASAQAAGDAAGIAEQRHEFDTVLGLTAPQRQIGNEALNALAVSQGYAPYQDPATQQPLSYSDWLAKNPQYSNSIGFSPGNMLSGVASQAAGRNAYQDYVKNFKPQGSASGTPGTPNYSAFYNSPGYQFTLGQGINAVQNSAAARGGLYSGNALRGINDYAEGQASTQYGNWFNQQAALAGIGQTATGQAGGAAQMSGANISNLLSQQGDARASGIVGQANSISNGLNQLGTLFGKWGSKP